MQHSGYKKVLDYVSASSRFRNRVNNVERTYTSVTMLKELIRQEDFLSVLSHLDLPFCRLG